MNIGKNCRPNANLRGLDKEEKFMEKKITLTTSDNGELTVSGTDEEIKKILMTLGEFILQSDTLRAANVHTLVEFAHYFWQGGKASPEDLAIAKKFFAAAEEYSDPEASDYLSELQDNPLIAEVMWLRAAERNAPTPVYDLQESYEEQANYWRKKIAGKNSDADEEILKSERLTFFNIYKRAFEGDLDAMKICLEFCEKETAYWKKREP